MPLDSALDADKRRVLREVFGFAGFRPGQEPVVDSMLAGRHTLAVMPTGAGKSLCFQLPALVKGGLAVVVSPLVALMNDQVAGLRLSGVGAGTINSAHSRDANVATWRAAQRGEVKLLYMAPERLMTGRMLEALQRLSPSLFVIDEAHCISQWGHSFRPEYETLGELRRHFPGVPIGAFTATADEATRRDIVSKVFGGEAAVFVAGFDRPNIRLSVTPRASWSRQMLDFIDARRGQAGIVYCLSRAKTERASALLREAGHRALSYHAGMEAADRNAAQDAFLTEPGVVMAATIAFGMGIDKPDVRFVLHTDIPGSVEAYYQEIGRAGRDGQPAEAMMLHGLDDIRMRRRFIDESEADEGRKRVDHRRLDALVAYADAVECRRRALLAYFGEESGDCGNCDVCLDPGATADATEEARLALEAVAATGERFGAVHIADVLTGKSNERAAALGHEGLACFGRGQAHSAALWKAALRQLVAGGYLQLDVGGYGGLSLSARGRGLLHDGGTVRLRLVEPVKPSRRKARGTAPAVEEGPEARLYAALKALRLEIARELSVPPYVVFHDTTLMWLAREKPTTQDGFAAVHGIGPAKVEAFADRFLPLIRQHGEAGT